MRDTPLITAYKIHTTTTTSITTITLTRHTDIPTHLQALLRHLGEVHAICSVNFPADALDLGFQGQLQRVQEPDRQWMMKVRR